jgi:hypothetical protein
MSSLGLEQFHLCHSSYVAIMLTGANRSLPGCIVCNQYNTASVSTHLHRSRSEPRLAKLRIDKLIAPWELHHLAHSSAGGRTFARRHSMVPASGSSSAVSSCTVLSVSLKTQYWFYTSVVGIYIVHLITAGLGGLAVSVLATGLSVAGSGPSEDSGFLWSVASTSFWGKVKPSVFLLLRYQMALDD